jgi:hypothetical protein
MKTTKTNLKKWQKKNKKIREMEAEIMGFGASNDLAPTSIASLSMEYALKQSFQIGMICIVLIPIAKVIMAKTLNSVQNISKPVSDCYLLSSLY